MHFTHVLVCFVFFYISSFTGSLRRVRHAHLLFLTGELIRSAANRSRCEWDLRLSVLDTNKMFKNLKKKLEQGVAQTPLRAAVSALSKVSKNRKWPWSCFLADEIFVYKIFVEED